MPKRRHSASHSSGGRNRQRRIGVRTRITGVRLGEAPGADGYRQGRSGASCDSRPRSSADACRMTRQAMLWLDRPRRKRIVSVPVWSLLAVLASLGAYAFAQGPSLLLLGVVCLALGVSELVWLSRDGDRIVIRKIGRRLCIQASVAAFGFRAVPGARGLLEVYLTDGCQRHRVLTLTAFGTRRVESSVARLSHAILGGMANPGAPGAALARADRDELLQAQARVQAYYRTSRWRRTGYWVIGVLVLYLIGMTITMLAMVP